MQLCGFKVDLFMYKWIPKQYDKYRPAKLHAETVRQFTVV